MNKYIPTIGLEVHAELKTNTKMFCNSKNDSDVKKPNVNICPICMGHPGTLPVINKKALMHVLRVGASIGGKLADFTEFDRKNYFYPDLPKGYQISQYKYPLVKGGLLNGIEITRVHLEEDTARSTHDTNETETLIDFNRSGIPLMELVTEPVVKSAVEAADFGKELQLLLRYLNASEANMDKGEMRVEANVSVSKDKKLGTKVELKNLNSFKVVEKAIDFEIKRQAEALERGEKVVQETRGWDEKKEVTFSQREKEEAHDYRYFPDPDLPKLKLSEVEDFNNIEKDLPELPWEKRERYRKEFGIKEEDIDSYIRNISLGQFFEEVVTVLTNKKDLVKIASNYITSDILGILKTKHLDISRHYIGKLGAEELAELVGMIDDGLISSRGVKQILPSALIEEMSAKDIAKRDGTLQKSDEGELKKIVEKIISENENAVEEYKKGKEKSLQFLIGQAMKETRGSANPQILAKLFKENIK